MVNKFNYAFRAPKIGRIYFVYECDHLSFSFFNSLFKSKVTILPLSLSSLYLLLLYMSVIKKNLMNLVSYFSFFFYSLSNMKNNFRLLYLPHHNKIAFLKVIFNTAETTFALLVFPIQNLPMVI